MVGGCGFSIHEGRYLAGSDLQVSSSHHSLETHIRLINGIQAIDHTHHLTSQITVPLWSYWRTVNRV